MLSNVECSLQSKVADFTTIDNYSDILLIFTSKIVFHRLKKQWTHTYQEPNHEI